MLLNPFIGTRILHTVLRFTLYFVLHCTSLHTVLRFKLYFASHCTSLHTVLRFTDSQERGVERPVYRMLVSCPHFLS
jgi:hypothetical protein